MISWRGSVSRPSWKPREDMTLEELVRDKREGILRLCAKHRARSLRVFGSLARGQADEGSDVDFLVELEPGRTLLDLGGLQQELESLLGRRVDVVTVRGLKGRIRDRVLREAVPAFRYEGSAKMTYKTIL